MRNKLMLLEELQEIDLKVDGFQVQKQGLLDEISALDLRLQEAREAVNARSAELAAVIADKQALEENLTTENANIARSEINLKEIKTQKEYQAVSKEIATAKKLIVELEEQVLQKEARTEELNAEIAAGEENLRQLDGNIAGQKGEVQVKIDQLEASIAADVKMRAEAVKGLTPAIIKRYDKLREMRRGIAVVMARDGNCVGCNMNIPPQLYNNLFRGDDIITCPHCQRILVLHQEPQG